MKAEYLIEELKKHDIGPYIEIPCSLLQPVILRLQRDESCEVVNPVNEAVGMGIAAGRYLSTKKIPMLLIQNSGLVNTLNALTSLHQIYRIPLLYLISWRGEPGTADAPEHHVLGAALKKILEVFDIPYAVLSEENFKKEISGIMNTIKVTKKPAALLLRRGLLRKEKASPLNNIFTISKSSAIDIIVSLSRDKAYLITTNGVISREVFYNLKQKGIEDINPPFYMLGSMGHALSIGLGVAQAVKNNKRIVVLDGDGGCLMHLGASASVGNDKPCRLIHIVLDDGRYASTGGQPTVSMNIDLCNIARGCGYRRVYQFRDECKLKDAFPEILKENGPVFVHILISGRGEKDRERVSEKYSCEKIKERFENMIFEE